MSELRVTGWIEKREGGEEILHEVVEPADGSVDEYQKAIDYAKSMAEEPPRPEDDDDR